MHCPENTNNRLSFDDFDDGKTSFLTKDGGKELKRLFGRAKTLESFDRFILRKSWKCAPIL